MNEQSPRTERRPRGDDVIDDVTAGHNDAKLLHTSSITRHRSSSSSSSSSSSRDDVSESSSEDLFDDTSSPLPQQQSSSVTTETATAAEQGQRQGQQIDWLAGNLINVWFQLVVCTILS